MKTNLFLLLAIISVFLNACQDALVAKLPEKKPKAGKKVIDTPVTKKYDTLKIAAVGDIMLGTSYPNKNTLPPDSGKSSFNVALRELKDADVTFGNLEGTLLDTGAPAYYKMHQHNKPWFFRMPTYYGGVLKDAGFNVLSLANNHIGDFGKKGRKSTTNILDSLGINYGGQLTHPSAIFMVKGVSFGFCAFAPNSNTLSLLDLKNAKKLIRQLKQQCNIVIVSFHGGGEGPACEHVPFKMESYFSEMRGDVHNFAHTAIDAGADLVFGNGPHVCRAMELYNNRLIAYSLGNFCTYRCVSVVGVCGFAPLLKVYLNKEGAFLNGRILAYRQTHNNGLEADSAKHAVKKIKELTEKDFPDSGISISDEGLIAKNF